MPLDVSTISGRRIRLAEILGALSQALDLTEGQPPGHCVRVCWIGMTIGRELGLSEDALSDLHYALVLKDLGCSSNAARICSLYLSDDLRFKRDSKLLGDRLPELLAFAVRHTGSNASLGQRIRAMVNIARHGGEIVQDLIETRCERGADIARHMRFGQAVAEAIHSLDEHWDGRGRPSGLRGTAIPLFSRIALLSQVVDVFHAQTGPDAAVAEVRARAGSWFDPDITAAFLSVAMRPAFWATLRSAEVEKAVLDLEPAQRIVTIDDDYLDDIAAGFARVVDAKSPYTAGHSDRVGRFADLIATELGFDGKARRQLKRAALLHDIGKLGVSNTILDKPGKLDDTEWVAMRGHAEGSRRILSRIATFGNIADIGGSHHERLDGKGYPNGLEGNAITLPVRIVTTADVCDALTASRPYRAALPPSKALAIMREDVGRAFDPSCFAALEVIAARTDLATVTAT